jgi:thioredoxin-related protein
MVAYRSIAVGVTSLFVGLLALAGSARAADDLWQTDFDAAKAKAKAEKKLLLVDFTGSDWCGWCKKLKSEVFDKEEFKKDAPKNFVLVELDYPRAKKQSDELKKQNAKLQKQYKIQGFPTILLLDVDGKVVAQTGYQAGGPAKYVKHLSDFVGIYETVVAMQKELKAAKGLDRAKVLDKMIEAYVKLNNPSEEIAAWDKEIVKLDPENQTGLKVKHQFRILMAEIEKSQEARKYAEMKASAEKALALSGITDEQKLDVYLILCQACLATQEFDAAKQAADKALALPGITGEQKQGVYFTLCQCYFSQGDLVKVVETLKKGIEAGPTTEQGDQFKKLLARFEPIAEAQQTVVKLKPELATAKGLDRAKVLDKLIDAENKLMAIGRGASPQEVEKWSHEVVSLDADNKAGLKKKHEFRLLLTEAGKLFQQQKKSEAQAAIAKALATPDLSGEQKQQAFNLAAMFYLRSEDMKKGLENLKKALEAAPNSERAPQLKEMIEQVEAQVNANKE